MVSGEIVGCTTKRFHLMLVTGGAGFIGSHLVDALLAAGQEPVVLDNLASGDRENLPDGAKLVEMDIADAAVVGAIAELNPEVVIHAAAQVSVAVSMQDPHLDLAVNVQGTANVIEGAKAASARRFVFISSGGGVYGESDGADEDTLPRPKSYYSAHKYLGERYVELSGLSYANARLANVYGTRQRSDLEGGVVAIFTERLHRGQPILINGTGEQRRDLVYVADVVDSLLAMARSDRDGTWNVGTGVSTSILELLRALESEIGPATEVRYGHPRPGDVNNSRLAIDVIENDLEWRPKFDLAAGIADMIRKESGDQ
jgi:UDP-glucose 4-epimerase